MHSSSSIYNTTSIIAVFVCKQPSATIHQPLEAGSVLVHHSNFASHRIHPNQRRIKQLRRSLLSPELHTPDPLHRARSSIDSINRQDPLEYQTFSTSSPSNSDRTSVFLFCDFDFSFGTIRDSFPFP